MTKNVLAKMHARASLTPNTKNSQQNSRIASLLARGAERLSITRRRVRGQRRVGGRWLRMATRLTLIDSVPRKPNATHIEVLIQAQQIGPLAHFNAADFGLPA